MQSASYRRPSPSDPTIEPSEEFLSRAAFRERSVRALERLAELPAAASQVARAIDSLGERIEFGLVSVAGAFERVAGVLKR